MKKLSKKSTINRGREREKERVKITQQKKIAVGHEDKVLQLCTRISRVSVNEIYAVA